MSYLNDMERLSTLVTQMLKGLGLTMQLFAYTLLLALPLGLLVALMRMSKFRPLSYLTQIYILVMRGTPLILQIFTFYFFLPQIVGYIDRFPATIIAFVLNYAAYFAEIYRGGISSIPQGQREAGKVLGMTRRQTFLRVVMPQVIKNILLPVSNEVITLVKDTALVTAVGLQEMYQVARAATSRTGSLEPLFLAGLVYLILNAVITLIFNWLNKRFDYYRT